MLTSADIEKWRESQGMTRKQLAEALHVNYKALCLVLSGKRPVSAKLSAAVEQLQADRAEGLKVRVPPDMLPVLQAWAERSDCTVEQVGRELLARALQVPGGGI